MRTLRNLAFLALVVTMFAVDRGELLASVMTPPFDNCSDGCTCTVTWDNWLEVTADCPDAAPAEECPYGFDACDEYCFDLGGYLTAYDPPNSYSCGLYEFEGDCEGPLGLEPPTSWLCGCFCWVS